MAPATLTRPLQFFDAARAPIWPYPAAGLLLQLRVSSVCGALQWIKLRSEMAMVLSCIKGVRLALSHMQNPYCGHTRCYC
jgi:hypothetical protein